jgi:hypothetical protein
MIVSAEEFVRLRSSENHEDYHRAATEEAPADVWIAVITRFPDMRRWVAHNKTVSLDVLRLLAADPDVEVRGGVAMKRKLDRALFEQLSRDGSAPVRAAIARNAKTPPDILARLSTDAIEFVRDAAAERISRLGEGAPNPSRLPSSQDET